MVEYFSRHGDSRDPTHKYELYPGKLVVKFKDPRGIRGFFGLNSWKIAQELTLTRDTKILGADIFNEGHANIKVTADSNWVGIEEGVARIYIYKYGREFLNDLKRHINR